MIFHLNKSEKQQLSIAILLPAVISAINYLLGVACVLFLLFYFSRNKRETYHSLIFIAVLVAANSTMGILNYGIMARVVAIIILTVFYYHYAQHYKLFLPLVLFFILASIITLLSLHIGGLNALISYILLLLIIPGLIRKAVLEQERFFVSALLLFTTGLMLLNLFLLFSGIGFAMHDRFAGLFSSVNGLALIALLNYILVDVLKKYYKYYHSKFLFPALQILILIIIFAAGSRNILFGWIIYELGKFNKFFGILFTLGGFFLLSFFQIEFILEQLNNFFSSIGLSEYFRTESLERGSGRFVAWEFARQHIAEAPIFGSGFGFTDQLFIQNQDYLNNLGHQGNAHNSFLTIALDTGIVGAVLFVVGWIMIMVKAAWKSKFFLPVLLTVLFTANFESWLTGSLNPWTIYLLLILVIIDSKNERSRSLYRTGRIHTKHT